MVQAQVEDVIVLDVADLRCGISGAGGQRQWCAGTGAVGDRSVDDIGQRTVGESISLKPHPEMAVGAPIEHREPGDLRAGRHVDAGVEALLASGVDEQGAVADEIIIEGADGGGRHRARADGEIAGLRRRISVLGFGGVGRRGE